MSKAYFISDSHFGAETPEREAHKREMFARFASQIENDAQLFILGDFFDFWFDYNTIVLREFVPLLFELKKLTSRGVKVKFFGGNHDWWVSHTGILAHECGIEFFANATEIEILGARFFIGHGDGIAPSDWGYRVLLKPFLRNRVNIALFKLIPASVARALARKVSSSSKLYTQERNAHFEGEYRSFAQKLFEQNIDHVIFGHLHLPIFETFEQNGKIHFYCNTGDFYKNFSYAIFENARLHFLTMPTP